MYRVLCDVCLGEMQLSERELTKRLVAEGLDVFDICPRCKNKGRSYAVIKYALLKELRG